MGIFFIYLCVLDIILILFSIRIDLFFKFVEKISALEVDKEGNRGIISVRVLFIISSILTTLKIISMILT